MQRNEGFGLRAGLHPGACPTWTQWTILRSRSRERGAESGGRSLGKVLRRRTVNAQDSYREQQSPVLVRYLQAHFLAAP